MLQFSLISQTQIGIKTEQKEPGQRPHTHIQSHLDLHRTIFTADELRELLQAAVKHRCMGEALAGKLSLAQKFSFSKTRSNLAFIPMQTSMHLP